MTARVTSLHIYPLKGGRAIDVASLTLDHRGPVDDRRWMMVDGLGDFLTQREAPALCLVTATPDRGGLALSRPGARPVWIPRDPEGAETRRVRIWNDSVAAIDQGDEAAAWCSAAVGRPVRLVRLADDAHRRTDPAYDPVGAQVSLADGYPMLLLGTASLAELNRRLALPLPMSRFRPNLVADTTEPHEEDRWRTFTIGGVQCDGVKPCARCVVTTTDQETAARGVEPLRTLAGYRRRQRGVMFGMNVVHRSQGTIRVGDPVTVSDLWSSGPT